MNTRHILSSRWKVMFSNGRRGSLGFASGILFLALWALILVYDLIFKDPEGVFSWMRIVFSAAMIALIALSLFGPKALRSRLSIVIDSPGRFWYVIMFAIGAVVFGASLADTVFGKDGYYIPIYAIFGACVGLAGLFLAVVNMYSDKKSAASGPTV